MTRRVCVCFSWCEHHVAQSRSSEIPTFIAISQLHKVTYGVPHTGYISIFPYFCIFHTHDCIPPRGKRT